MRSSVCSDVTKEDRPPNDDDIVLNSTCFKDGEVVLGGV